MSNHEDPFYRDVSLYAAITNFFLASRPTVSTETVAVRRDGPSSSRDPVLYDHIPVSFVRPATDNQIKRKRTSENEPETSTAGQEGSSSLAVLANEAVRAVPRICLPEPPVRPPAAVVAVARPALAPVQAECPASLVDSSIVLRTPRVVVASRPTPLSAPALPEVTNAYLARLMEANLALLDPCYHQVDGV